MRINPGVQSPPQKRRGMKPEGSNKRDQKSQFMPRSLIFFVSLHFVIIPTTIAQAHRGARQYLMDGGQTREEAHLAVRLLLDHLTSTPHAHLTRAGEEWGKVLDGDKQAHFLRALEELKSGRPLAFVLGTSAFYGLEFRCDERALIPRPETELLIETLLYELSTRPPSLPPKGLPAQRLRIADLGTGTGCIAVTLATQLPEAEIFATDVSPAALKLARENAYIHGVENRIRFLAGKINDWAAPLLEWGKFDCLLSNPPYIAAREIEELQIQIKKFEPRAALDGGEDGLNCYRELAVQCRVLLKPGGALLCELGYGQFEDVRAIFEACNWSVENPVFDGAGIARVALARIRNQEYSTE
jgi:release factor glutamine methyltransferase